MSHDFNEEAQASRGNLRWGAIALTAMALLLVCAIVLPPLVNANRFRGRLRRELSAALGRPVQMDNVSLRLLPRPGFDFENFEVAADPQFGAEPVVRAARVTVYVRLLPLARGEMQAATISLQDASLNIARSPEGQWNFAALLERTSEMPAQTPTGQARGQAGPPFPYLEVANGRINFKRGEEKLPFSFTDADFSLWLASPGAWQLRFRATPVRTDMDAGYTGELRLAATIRRGAQGLGSAQIALTGSWRRAPLGEVERVLFNQERGWRGEAAVDFSVNGTVANADAQARLAIDGLRREDFVPIASLPLEAACAANLQMAAAMLTSASCATPAGDGRLSVDARQLAIAFNTPPRAHDFAVTLDRVPAAWLLSGLRLARQGMAPDLSAEGEFSGRFAFDRDAPARWSGQAAWMHGQLRAGPDAAAIVLPTVTIAAAPATSSAPPRAPHSRGRRALPQPPAAGFRLTPFLLPLGGDAPVAISGVLQRAGYDVTAAGSAQLQQIAPLVRALGFARWAVLRSVTGVATGQVRVRDAWRRNPATPPAEVEGAVTLRNVTLESAWAPGPIALAQGKFVFSPTAHAWQNLAWTWAGARFDGGATRALQCEPGATCGWRLTAHAPAANLQQIVNILRPSATEALLAFFRGNSTGGWPPAQIDLTVDALTAGRLTVAHFSAGLNAANATLEIARCSGVVLASEMECFGSIALDRGAAQLSIAASRASLAAAGALFKENWGVGAAEASLQLNFNRGAAPQGTFTAMLRNAAFTGAPAGSPLAAVQSWQLAGDVLHDHLQIDRSLLTSGGKDYRVTGAIGFDRRLDLQLAAAQPGAAPRPVDGTLQAPRLK